MNFKDSIFGFVDEFIDPCLCNAWIATAVIGSSVLGAGATIFGANKAAAAFQLIYQQLQFEHRQLC